MLTGVAVVYDWLYDDLDPDTRATLRRTLLERGRLMYRQSKKMYWRDAYLQNHLWVSLAGLAASASALEDDAEAAEEAAIWMSACLEKFRRTEALLGPDGASQEGLTYWTLGLDGLLRFWALANDLTGEKSHQQVVGEYGLLPAVPGPATQRGDGEEQSRQLCRLHPWRVDRTRLPVAAFGIDVPRPLYPAAG